MEFKYLEENCKHPLIDHFYQLKINETDLPFKTLIIPLGQNNITYVFNKNNQIAKIKNKEIFYKDLVVTGLITGSYHIEINSESDNIGFAMKPTALYKIFKRDISEFNNKHTQLNLIDINIHNIFNKAFLENRLDKNAMIQAVYKIFDNLKLSDDINLQHIDKCIAVINKKEGLLKVNDLLNLVPFSQKSLEVQFKRIVGITPGKYIKQFRFTRLIQKYTSGKYNISDLLYMFNYYDKSHFYKDFKLFVGQTPNAYFKENYPLIKEYLRRS
jgi:AraC-like DNA-binding protein